MICGLFFFQTGGPASDFDLRVLHLSRRLTGGAFDFRSFIGIRILPLGRGQSNQEPRS
jgi:hypothetical protein